MKLEETPYMLLGGEEEVRRLVDRFYELMDNLPEAWDVRKIHQADLSCARDKLFKYLSGWLGGPSLYITEYGQAKLERSHASYNIGVRESDQWLFCMNQAMQDLNINEELREHLNHDFITTVELIRNS